MKASELRVGNLIEIKCIAAELMTEDSFDVQECNVYNLMAICDEGKDFLFRPILLTEEWLIKFGFVSNSYQDRYENKAIHVECNKTRGFIDLWIERMPHIKYVHQLQNLYFALTGEELTLKP